ncbi:MAG: hypothetical protein VX656_20860, partial [Candidatus Latescibacterota bacterium]|nr:hypothetical protein [Candidatus Latescibacterota bacterium]
NCSNKVDITVTIAYMRGRVRKGNPLAIMIFLRLRDWRRGEPGARHLREEQQTPVKVRKEKRSRVRHPFQ